MVVDFVVHALKVAILPRDGVSALPAEWESPGVYALLGAITPGTKTEIYVGKAVGLRSRLLNHHRKPKLGWWRAIAVIRDTTNGFNSAEIGYLEGRLARQVASLPGAELRADRFDLDTTLPDHLLIQLDAFISTILAALRLAGLDTRPEPDEDTPEQPGVRTYTPVPGSVVDLLSAGLLEAGATLTAARGGRSAAATVTASGDLLVDGVSYASPSTAAAKGLGVQSANGWKTWRLAGDGPFLADLRAQLNHHDPDQ